MADAYISVRRYPMLYFAAHVDWRHIKLALLNRLSVLAAKTGHPIYIFSGYRSNKVSQQVGGFAGDPHTQGVAVDARVDGPAGKMIGSFFSVKTLAQYGLRSGNTPNFYKGKPDPEHVDLIGFGYSRTGAITGSLAKDPYASKAAAALPAPVGVQTPNQVIGTQPMPQTTAAPELTSPPVALPPGTVQGGQSPVGAQQFWKKVLDQPSVTADTQQYARMFQ